ncbi:MAG TPA: enoyl-CoA hydratase/isomerase family protein [Rhodospirillaceae bacterium]|nr:enoyl-CoA hydratase/isomerase family protein [Rhodospirillaceae bacterium]
MPISPHLRVRRLGRLGHITLDRPAALNALDHGMIRGIRAALEQWRTDTDVVAVVMAGTGRAFAAGGDIKVIAEALAAGDWPFIRAVYADEYRLDSAIHHYPKPVISFLDGIVMGGGAGISILGSHRVATGRTLFAMPEVTIGSHPDAGGSWFLPRLPDFVGRYLGLTGTTIGAADCLDAGLATHFVPAERLPALLADLARDPASLEELLARYGGPAGAPKLERQTIRRVFGGASLQAVLDALADEVGPWAEATRQALAAAAPTSLVATFQQLQRGAGLDLELALTYEYRLSLRMMAADDFREGVRALLIDRDRAPRWRPATLAEVETSAVDALSLPLGREELDFR